MERKIQKHIMKNKEIFVGLEDSKRSWKICVRSSGVVVHETSMPADYKVLQHYFHNKFPDCQISVIYEAGFKGFNLYDQLTDNGWQCVVTPPHTITEEKCSRTKNDRIDCRRMAKNLENNDYKICHVHSKQQREDRQVSRLYGQTTSNIVRACNRIRRMLEFHGLDGQLKSGRWSRHNYKILEGMIKDMDITESLKFSFNVMFENLNHLWTQKKNILRRLKDLANGDNYKQSVKLLRSAPGVGLLTAIRLVLEWGDLGRFKTKEQFSSFLGLSPSEYSTGETERKGHITKQGYSQVRKWLVESAWVAIRYDQVLLKKFQDIYGRCGSKKIAIVAVARKLAMRLRALLTTEKEYVIGVLE